jgi:hypothetical protein
MNINQILSDELTENENDLLEQLLLMTGREDRRKRRPVITNDQLPSIRAICPKLRSAKQDGIPPAARCDLLNRLLLCLSIMPVSQTFFNTVFEDIDFSDGDAFESRVESFRILCMLDYGNFRFGYKKLRQDDELIKREWMKYFPSPGEAQERERWYQNRPEPEGLVPIEPRELFALGSLENKQTEDINSARDSLRQIFTEALAKEVGDFEGIKKVASERGIRKLTSLIAEAGLPRAEELVDPQIGDEVLYRQVLSELLLSCAEIDNDGIDRIRKHGIQNANTYMAMRDLNVYVATSMRAPLHFTTNWAFVNTLFHSGQLGSWKLRYFDPTQTYMQSRIQMGLLECLMIKRTKLTVYHAQESDTFGKDCEAGVTLAQAKPVVVFVTRLFDRQSKMGSLYAKFDEAARKIHRDDFFAYLREERLLEKEQVDSLLNDPEKSKADAIETVVQNYVPPILKEVGSDRVEMELIRQGYVPPDHDASKYALDRIINLERRALTFRDVHPLALQASPNDGVARGVIVTRTVDDTAKVVSGLLTNTLSYEIVWEKENWLLLDSITRSPVRVVTNDPVLTSAFWSEQWGPKG